MVALQTPKTLQAAIEFFSDPDRCHAYVVQTRWPDGIVTCPFCNRPDPRYLANQRRFECRAKHPRRQFSVKVGTIFEDSPIPLDKWLATIWMIANDKNGISSYEVGRAVGVTQKSAWFMLQRIRLAMQDGTFNKASGTVEIDETYIGGKARNLHKAQRKAANRNGASGKAAVMGFLERSDERGKSRVRATAIPNAQRPTIDPKVREYVEPGSSIYTDGHGAYRFLGDAFAHEVVSHDAGEYVRENIHTNGIENFWSLLKRGLHGTYVSVEPFHLFRYIDEQVFRFNSRDLDDAGRFRAVVRALAGKRLTYEQLISSGTTPA